MNYFFSGIETFKGELRDRLACECTHRLQSCHGAYIKSAYAWAEAAAKNPGHQELMLDSGAFTAWSKGDEVHLDQLITVYGDLLEKYAGSMKEIWLINLDKIPGAPGRTAGLSEINEAIEISDSNYAELVRAFGNRVLPVFHQNENEQRLQEVVDMADYVCISPRNDLPEKSRVSWSQYVHGLHPGMRSHGLATTGSQMLTTVPWHSADSASWVFAGAMGGITFLLDQKLVSISISTDSPSLQDLNKHFDTMPTIMQDCIAQRIEGHGLTVDAVRALLGQRMAFNMLETMSWMRQLKTCPVQQPSLFGL